MCFIGGSLLCEVKRGLSWFEPPGGLNWVDAETLGLGHVLAAEQGRTGERYILGGENVSHWSKARQEWGRPALRSAPL